MEGVDAFEKSCIDSLQDTFSPIESMVLFRALQRGDTVVSEMPEEDFLELLSLESATSWSTEAYATFRARVQEGVLAFPRFLAMEQYIAQEVARRLSVPGSTSSFFGEQEKLNEQQKEALKRALTSPIFFLTGGPGTGKTYTVGMYLKLFLRQSKPSRRPLKVLLLAPTGKAVKALEHSIRRALDLKKECDESLVEIHAMTLHAFLIRNGSRKIDLALIDESSMIDTELFYRFLKAVDESTCLLFLGDKDQLPPIEPGQPFADIVHILEKRKDPHVYRLTLCERTDAVELLKFSRAVCEGNDFDPLLFGGEVQFFQADSVSSCSASFWQECETRWLERICRPWVDPTLTKEEALSLSTNRVLLTPERQGLSGSDEIIRRAGKRLALKESVYAPVLATKNSYELEVMNGEIGLLERTPKGLDAVFFGDRKVPLVLLEQWQLAYAMTVHKSQGSEFQEVHLLLPPTSTFSRKLLYTAATRARKALYIYGTQETIQKAISLQKERMTALRDLFDRILIKAI